MKKALFFLLLSRLSFGQTPANDPHWQLVWQDDFDVLNTSVWEVFNNVDHFEGQLSTNTFADWEPQVYTSRPDNVFVSGGNLVLRLKSEPYTCPPGAVAEWGCSRQWKYGVSYNYTSGEVASKEAYNTQFGYIEARMLLPHSSGFWPAFWTLIGPGVPQTNVAEIDIFEMLGDLPSTHFTTNIHRGYTCPPDCSQDYYSEGIMADYSGSYHTYAVEWSPSKIIWYIDNYPVRVLASHGIVDPVKLILNFAVKQGHWPTAVPADMLVDYVKVYELNSNCSDYINTMQYDFSTYDNVEKNFIKIGSGGGNNSLTSGQDIKMRASQYIELSGDFYVPVGAALYLDANKECSTDMSLNCTYTFNPCTYDFSFYDNTVKGKIELGRAGCSAAITPGANDVLLQATDEIVLKPEVIVTPASTKSVEMKIVPCN